ncbi:MAG: radical SAM protein [Candidatus Omnitrophota bacterium]
MTEQRAPRGPAYKDAGLAGLSEKLEGMLADCRICPRSCGVNRAKGQKGFCRVGREARVYSYLSHHGEEPPISGTGGSGTIFFSGCNMRCVYCQNYKFSQTISADGTVPGRAVSAEELAEIMLGLQASGCHNINLVTPGHVLPQIIAGLVIASGRGLNIPLVYNTGGYDSPEMIGLLEKVVDIYLVDMRYAEEENAVKYSLAPGYPAFNLAAVKEMCRQRPAAIFDQRGIMREGVIVRHLVLPENISGTKKVLERLARAVPPENVHLSLMSQYLPCNKAQEYRELSRRVSREEYSSAADHLAVFGFSNGWVQEANGSVELAGVNIRPKHFKGKE